MYKICERGSCSNIENGIFDLSVESEGLQLLDENVDRRFEVEESPKFFDNDEAFEAEYKNNLESVVRA